MGAFLSVVRLVPVIVTAISSIEQAARMFGVAIKGKEKQDAAMNLVTADFQPALGLSPQVLASPAVVAAIRDVIDAIVRLANAVRDASGAPAAAIESADICGK